MDFQKIGRYEVRSSIGKGGMATIYLAHDPMFGRDVAIKVLPREFLHDPSFRGRFEREARTIATLEHPAIVPVYDFGEEEGQPYLVMRYMRGGSLADRLAEGPLNVQEAAHVLERIGGALDHAHMRGIVHRDLKPGNILFDEYGEPFLADFGIVKIAEATATYTGGGIVGTPAYMSPEQVHGDKTIDGRSDIYTLGVILFEMLTGQMPYRADTPAKLMMAHVLNPTPRILDVNPNLPPESNAVISKAMAKKPDERFTTASEMAKMLTGPRTTPDIPAPSAATAPTVMEPLPPDVPSPTVAGETAAPPAAPPASPGRPVTPPPGTRPDAVEARPAGSNRSRLLITGAGLLLFLVLCCGLAALAYSQFGGGDGTPTIEVADAAGTATAEALAAGESTATPSATATEEVDTAATEAAQDAAATQAAQEAAATATARALEEIEEATAEAAAGATAAAAATATAESIEPPEAQQARSEIAALQLSAPVAASEDGSLAHLEDGFIEAFYAGVNVADFVVEATFYNPYNLLEGSWDYGFMFRDTGTDNQYRLAVESNGFWSLGNRTGDDFELMAEGELENLDVSGDGSNTLLLYAIGNTGYFFLNDVFVTTLDLSARTEAGDIAVAIGLYEGNEVEGEETLFEGFNVWSDDETAAAPPTATQPPAGPTSTAPPPPPPTADVTDQLLGSMRSVRNDLQSMGGMIDNAVNTGFVNCQDVINTYDRIANAPSYSGLSGQAQSAHSSYRSAISVFTNGARDMYQNCVDFLAGGQGSIPFQQWGSARQSVNQALDIINPAIDDLESA